MPPSKNTFLESLRIQNRVIWALMMRESITRYGRNNFGFLWLVIAPVLLIVMIISARVSRSAFIHGLSVIAFFITGYCGAFMLRKISSRCLNAIEPNRTLMFHRNVKVFDIYIARISIEAAGETTAFILLLLSCYLLNLIPFPANILEVVSAWFLLIWFGAALALTVGPLSEFFEIIGKIWPPLNILLIILSGAFFMVDWLPAASQGFFLKFPWIHGMEMLREGYFGSQVKAHYDPWYLIFWCLLLSLVGLLLMQSAIHKDS